MSDGVRSSSIARRSAEPAPRTWVCPTSSSSARGRTRCASGAASACRSAAASAKRSPTAPEYAPSMAGEAAENYSEPMLEGTAPSDYERYLNTEELLRLQKGPDQWVHRDELLFQVTHQSSELWLKLCWSDTQEA